MNERGEMNNGDMLIHSLTGKNKKIPRKEDIIKALSPRNPSNTKEKKEE